MKKILIWVGSILGGLVALLVLIVVVLYAIGTSRINKVYDVEVAAVAIPSGPAALEKGRRLVESIGLCVECHGENLGGDILAEDALFGTLAPTNPARGTGPCCGPGSSTTASARLRLG